MSTTDSALPGDRLAVGQQRRTPADAWERQPAHLAESPQSSAHPAAKPPIFIRRSRSPSWVPNTSASAASAATRAAVAVRRADPRGAHTMAAPIDTSLAPMARTSIATGVATAVRSGPELRPQGRASSAGLMMMATL